MNITIAAESVTKTTCDALAVGFYSDGTLTGAAQQVDNASQGLLTRLKERKELTGKLYETLALYDVPGVAAPLVVTVGLGDAAKVDAGVAYRAAACAARFLSQKQRGKVALFLNEGPFAPFAAASVAGAAVGCQGQDLYRIEKKRFPFGEITFSGATATQLERGNVLGETLNLARKLVNEPAQEMYPESFAKAAETAAKEVGLRCEVWDKARLEKERCGSLLAVAKGSERPPRLVILEHRGGKAGEAPIALVGKGVTFDSGGLSLKPTDGMTTMKCDMAGAAAVLATMTAIARLKLPVNVVGLAGLVENMTGGAAMKLGDVLTARSGKTIEVLNTDAEGRLVLADVLNVALDYKPSKIVDLATLTGACVVALGTDVVGAMANDQAWCDTVMGAARKVGEPIWQLPMFPEYNDMIRSEVADIKNTGDGRWGGAIAAAKFLEEFVAGTPWVHLDIAGPAFFDKPKPWADGGGTGCMVRTLVELLAASD
ncbi:MAG: leucyl aminopeptidase [Planctomycetes bacterium]|nr:leucyl aminopeptidase [Planctomycetota bacterium]